MTNRKWEAGTSSLWLVDEQRPLPLPGLYIDHLSLRPEKHLLTLRSHCPEPAYLIYPFQNGIRLELREHHIGEKNEYDNTHLQVSFLNCRLDEAWMTDVNEPQDTAPLWLRLEVECEAVFNWGSQTEFANLNRLNKVIWSDRGTANER